MKTKRENFIADCVFAARKLDKRTGWNIMPEGLYGYDGRRCDAFIQTPKRDIFLEIFGGKNLSYMRDRFAMRDSRVFNKRVVKDNVVFHLVANDDAFLAMNGYVSSKVQQRFADQVREISQYQNHEFHILPNSPSNKNWQEVADRLIEISNS